MSRVPWALPCKRGEYLPKPLPAMSVSEVHAAYEAGYVGHTFRSWSQMTNAILMKLGKLSNRPDMDPKPHICVDGHGGYICMRRGHLQSYTEGRGLTARVAYQNWLNRVIRHGENIGMP